MSDYRFQIVEHNGIPCLHVMIEVTDDNYDDDVQQSYIPLDDIEAAGERYLADLSQNLNPEKKENNTNGSTEASGL